MAELDLERLERLAQAATPGPWEWWTSNSFLRLSGPDGRDGGVLYACNIRNEYATVVVSEADRRFIAEARTALPALIARNRELERLNAVAYQNGFSDGRKFEDQYAKGWNDARRATDGQRAGLPEGYVVVPVELTPEMVKAGANSGGLGMNFHEWMGRLSIAWRHMLAAAPTPPAGDAGQEQMDAALRTIAEWPITPVGNMDAENMRQLARAAIAASKGEAP